MNEPKSRNRRSDIFLKILINAAIVRQQSAGSEHARAFLVRSGVPETTISRVIAGINIRPLPRRKGQGRSRQVDLGKVSSLNRPDYNGQ